MMVIRHDERIARFARSSANSAGRLKSGDAAPQIVEALPLDLIDPDPDQPRRHFDEADLDALAESLRTVGQLQPIVVIRQGERYRLHIGERRWRAAGRAGLGTVRALVRATPLEARAARIAQIVENDQRAPLTTSEMVEAVRDLQTDGLKGVEIAAALSKPKSRISEYAALADAPAELRILIDTLGLALSYQLLRQWRSQPDATLDFLRLMPVDHISRITIATIGEAAAVAEPALASEPAARTPSTSEPQHMRGEGASPRDRAATPVSPLPVSPAVGTQDGAIGPGLVGSLVIEHPAFGEGRLVFDPATPPDHMAVRFADRAPVLFHKDDVRILRALDAHGAD